MSCEITRLLKLCDDGVQPVSVIIPRRDKNRFHEELFPPAPGMLTIEHLSMGVYLFLVQLWAPRVAIHFAGKVERPLVSCHELRHKPTTAMCL